MIFIIIAQIVILLVNLALLIISKLTTDFHQLIYIIPVVIYSISMIVFYMSYLKTTSKYHQGVYGTIIVAAAILMNVMYAVTEIFIEDPENPVLFYICTSVAQVINLMFLFSYMKQFAMRLMGSSQFLIHKILSYVFVVLSLITLYSCFVNVFLTVLLLIATSFFAAVASVMFLLAARSRHR